MRNTRKGFVSCSRQGVREEGKASKDVHSEKRSQETANKVETVQRNRGMRGVGRKNEAIGIN